VWKCRSETRFQAVGRSDRLKAELRTRHSAPSYDFPYTLSAFIELRQQPRFGEAPGPLDGAFRDAQHFGDFAILQTGEEAVFDDLGFARVLKGEPIKRLVHVQQPLAIVVVGDVAGVPFDPARGTFKSWLLNLTRWRIADQFRRRDPAAAASAPPSDGSPTRTPTVERIPGPDNLAAEWEIEWKRNIVETALARVGRKVKPKHLQIFDLYAMRHWPAGKVARELGVTRVQVYLVTHRPTTLRRARKFPRTLRAQDTQGTARPAEAAPGR